MTDIVHIVEFDLDYLAIFKKYQAIIKEALPNSIVELVGSASVPMPGKPEIDILVEAEPFEDATKILQEKGGFDRFPSLLSDKAYFNDKRFGIECEIHMHSKNHEMASKLRMFRDLLKENKDLRVCFMDFKKSCDGKTRLEYRQLKTAWIKEHCPQVLSFN